MQYHSPSATINRALNQPFFFVLAAAFDFLADAATNRSAVPLWIAICSVLSLLMRYWGDSVDAWCVYPLNFASDVTFLMMTPLTHPASEFHRTWSPRLNVFRILSPLSWGQSDDILPTLPCIEAKPETVIKFYCWRKKG